MKSSLSHVKVHTLSDYVNSVDGAMSDARYKNSRRNPESLANISFLLKYTKFRSWQLIPRRFIQKPSSQLTLTVLQSHSPHQF